MSDKELIVSLHIPKTAGITLKNILSDVYGDSFLWFTQTNTARGCYERIRHYDLSKIKCIHSHVAYGIHKYLEADGVKCRYITFIRNPYERLMSLYNYILTDPVNEHYKWDESFGWTREMGFQTWLLDCKLAAQDNDEIRFLSGCENLNTDGIKYNMSQSDFVMARRNLKKFDFVGFTENFDNEIITLAKILGWNSIPEYVRSNVGPVENKMSNLSIAGKNTVRSTNNYSLALWNHITLKKGGIHNVTRYFNQSPES